MAPSNREKNLTDGLPEIQNETDGTTLFLNAYQVRNGTTGQLWRSSTVKMVSTDWAGQH
jgi:hypothetical protein